MHQSSNPNSGRIMRSSFRIGLWCPILLLVFVLTMAKATQIGQVTSSTSRKTAVIPVDPKVASLFPSVQFSGACRTISIEGLGQLDGDYTLTDGSAAATGRSSWVGTRIETHKLVVSCQTVERAWTITGYIGSITYRAFLSADCDLPPARSVRWQVFSEASSTFEGVKNPVSVLCPACAAVAVSALPDSLDMCNGPYRPTIMYSEAGVSAWLHVNDERCIMLHDIIGNSVITTENPPVPRDAAGAHGVFFSHEWLKQTVENHRMRSSPPEKAKVACTAAGKTTRIVFDLVESQENIIPRDGVDAEKNAISSVKSTEKFVLIPPKNGSIVSSAQSNVHLRISRAQVVRLSKDANDKVLPSGLQLGGVNARESEVFLKVTVNRVTTLTTSLENLATAGMLILLHGIEGTNIFEICLLGNKVESVMERQPLEEDECVAEAVFILEIFTAETQMVHRRYLSEKGSSSSAMDGVIGVDEGDVKTTQVIFVSSLQVVDGTKLSILHLVKNLPNTFQASILDLSCASDDFHMKEEYEKEDIDIFRVCMKFSLELWEAAERENTKISIFLYRILANAATWEDAISASPDAARGLEDLYSHLKSCDSIVISNGGGDNDAYMLQVARLAGVINRVVNLGALTHGYMSPFFSAATSLIAPSHYVAHNPAVIRNTGGLAIKVCHPVMDAIRVVEAARVCLVTEQSSQLPASPKNTEKELKVAGQTSNGVDSSLSSTTFISVGRFEGYKTPGMFVRSLSILRRRYLERGGQAQQVQGVMVGTGILLGNMKTFAHELNAGIRFTGFLSIDEVPCEVQHATALVIPSMAAETFGMVGPEAMLLGVPVITFGFGGAGELVRHMENGIIVFEPTPRALADAFELLAGDRRLRDRLGAQARLDALRALSLPEMVACHTDELR